MGARLLLVAIGFGFASINGIEHSAGILDLIGGILIAIAILTPRRRHGGTFR